MNTLFEAFNNIAETENGCLAHHSTMEPCLDFFYKAGASRGEYVSADFVKALSNNKELTIRTLLWMRDAREGAGERQQFKNLLQVLVDLQDDVISDIIPLVPEMGRWDDLLVFTGTKFESQAFGLISSALRDENGLCAKWMPRQGKVANSLRKHLKITTPKEYRKLLVSLTDVVEQKMCSKQWDQIDFEVLPSVAAARYQKAFSRNAEKEYGAYKEKLVKGEVKINASAVYPYDVVKSVNNGDGVVASHQWKALPNYLEGSTDRILPIVDVSGSMFCPAGGSSSKSQTTCMDVAISLGLYICERVEGVFKDVFMTFSEQPQMVKVEGSLQERVLQMKSAPWGMNTNIEAVFNTLVSIAKRYQVPEEQMPTKLLIISDMQFDQCMGNGNNLTAYEICKEFYELNGYKLPQIVFWNVNCSMGTVPVTVGAGGTALVSGFSPSIMQSLLKGELSPERVMLDTVMKDRYKYS